MCLGIPGKLVSTHEKQGGRFGIVEFDGVEKEVNLAYQGDAELGSYLLVHLGFAIEVLDEADALESIKLMQSVGLLEDDFEALAALRHGPLTAGEPASETA